MAGLQQRKDRPRYHFVGDATLRPTQAHKDSPQELEPYVVEDPELKQAIDLAMYLRRPLLLEGEAGCGKTQLARAIAYELGLPFYRWDIRSTSLAKEGLYEYDALLRLHDVQMSQSGTKLGRDPRNPGNYLRFGALGNAFRLADCPAIVLIDEIDKADLDFPNDLLTVLDEPWAFDVSEATGDDGKPMRVGPAAHPPIVIITSNREKGYLPLPFLRRCIYYYMKFPDKAGLKAIVEAHYGEIETQSEVFSGEVVDVAIDKLLSLREASNLFKNPSTSEFLDWIDALLQFGNAEQMMLWLRSSDVKRIPFRELLFKVQKDWDQFTAATVVGG
jgi:MoxR-like ATPase